MTTKNEMEVALTEVRTYQKTNYVLLKDLSENFKEFQKEGREESKKIEERIASLESSRAIFRGVNKVLISAALIVFASYMGVYFVDKYKQPQTTTAPKKIGGG